MDFRRTAFVSAPGLSLWNGSRRVVFSLGSRRVEPMAGKGVLQRRGRVMAALGGNTEVEEAGKQVRIALDEPRGQDPHDASSLEREEQAKRIIEESRNRVRALELRNWLRSSQRVISRARQWVREVEEFGREKENWPEPLRQEFDILTEDLRVSENVLISLAEADSPEVETLLAEMRWYSAALADTVVDSLSSTPESEVSGHDAAGAGTPNATKGDEVEPDVESASIPKRVKSSATEVSARVRNDLNKKVDYVVNEIGTLNFEKVKTSTQWTFERAGETWSRLNGVEATGNTTEKTQPEVHAPPADSELTVSLRKQIDVLEGQLVEASKARESMLRQEDQLGKLIRAKQIRSMDDVVIQYRRELAVRVLQLEMERIYRYLESEIDAADEFLDVQLLIAEFAELDESLAELHILLDQNDALAVPDGDVGELATQIQYLKARLGLEKDLYTRQLNWAVLKGQAADLFKKTQEGGDFLVRGFRLIGGDVNYASKLVQKAATGSVLTPREVRTMRRTAKDVLTILPFTIIMIIPLTPVGHVLIFSFIQRFLPDFFPSTFSEERVDFMKRYEKMQELVQSKEQSARQAGLPNLEKDEVVSPETHDDRSIEKLVRAQAQLRSYRKDLHLAE